MEWLIELYRQYDLITKNNPLAATLMIPLVGGLVGGVIYFFKNVPSRIGSFIKRNTTVTLSLNNAGWDGNIDAYIAFDKWFMQSGSSKMSRNFFMFRQWSADLVDGETYKPYRIGIGNGMHFFFYNRRFFWFRKGTLDSSGAERQKEEIKISTIGWSGSCFDALTDLFNERKVGNTTTVHTQAEAGWTEFGKIIGRDINTFCMNRNVRFDIIEKIQKFIDEREWYLKKGFTHKVTFLLYGPPGTGKTTLVKLLAFFFRRDIYQLDLSACTNRTLVKALSTAKPGSIVLVEDVDQAGSAVRDRKKDQKEKEGTIGTTISFNDDFAPLTMSGVLNAFDGVVGLDNLIIIFTTNHPEDLDPAIRRKSRIDHEFLIDLMGSSEIYDFISLMYDDMSKEHSDRVKSLLEANNFRVPGCVVEHAFKEHRDNPILFLSDLHAHHINNMPLD